MKWLATKRGFARFNLLLFCGYVIQKIYINFNLYIIVAFWCLSYITVKFHLNLFRSYCVKEKQTPILTNFYI